MDIIGEISLKKKEEDFFKETVLLLPIAKNKRPYTVENTQHVGEPWQAREEQMNGVWNLGWNTDLLPSLD